MPINGKNQTKKCLVFQHVKGLKAYEKWGVELLFAMTAEFDHEKIAELFESRFDLLLATARRFAPMPDLVHDIVQEVFIEFAQSCSRKNRDLETDVTPLLRKMVRDVAVDFWKREQKHSSAKIIHLAEQLGEAARKTCGHEDDEKETVLPGLRECIEQLPDSSRRIVKSHYFERISLEQIAKENAINPGTLRKSLFRIREKLRRCVELRKTEQNNDDDR